MSKVITFSKFFPAYHPRKGEPTFFVEQIQGGLKVHTIRAGSRWKVGDKFSPRIWSGKPYRTPQLTIAPDIEIKKIWDVEIAIGLGGIRINGDWNFTDFYPLLEKLSKNDGLTISDFKSWFNTPSFIGQIICWNENINY